MHPTTIAGKTFNVADRYAEGHALTANEASALNQLRRENIRNNLAGTIKDQVESGAFDQDAGQASVDAYAASYEFGVRTGGGGGSRDPVQTMAMNLARETLKANIVKSGKKIADYPAKQISEAAAKLVAKDPRFLKEAQKRVKALESASSEIDLDDALGAPEPQAEQVEEASEGTATEGTAPALSAETAA